MNLDPTTTKYVIRVSLTADGVVEKPDVIGAIFGQTEGLLGDDLDLRDLQKSGRIGRIEVSIESKRGKSSGDLTLPSSLDKVETVILAAALESIDRIGPCKATVKVEGIDDVRASKRQAIVDRAKQLMNELSFEAKDDSEGIVNEIKKAVRVEEIVAYGPDKLPAGPNVGSSDAILVVEGRNDVANLLTNGIKNAIAVEGTSIPDSVVDLCKEKVCTAVVDGDRGGELILKELLQRVELDFVCRAPPNMEVEELSHKQVMKTLRGKAPAQQFLEQYGISGPDKSGSKKGGRSKGGSQSKSSSQSKGRSKSKGSQDKKQKSDRSKTDDRRRKGRSRGKKDDSGKGRSQKSDSGSSQKGGRSRKSGGKGRSKKQDKAPEPKMDDEMVLYRDTLAELQGSLKAVFLDDNGKTLGDSFPVRNLADSIRKDPPKNAETVVFDGVITQRLLDLSREKGLPRLVGVKMGNVTQRPDAVEIITRDKLGI